MTTPDLRTTPVGGFSGGPDEAHADLIARLAREAFRGLRQGGGAGALDPREGISAKSVESEAGLAGAYPSVPHPLAPPVHPDVHPPSTRTSNAGALASGTHHPGSRDSHAFGEPHCYRELAIQSRSPDGRSGCPLHGVAEGESASAAADHEGSRYYFLGEDTPRSSSGTLADSVTLSRTLDVDRVRNDFPALHREVNGRPLIWLDNAATTHKPQAVIDATSRFYAHDNSNIHRAAHAMAARATELYEGAREKVQRFLGAADVREIVFVRGTTEAINLVAQTFGRKFIGSGDEILLTTMEHHANIVPWQMLAQQTGAVLRVAPINDRGELILDQFVGMLGSRTKLVSVTHVANALGTVNPIEEIIAIAHAHGVPVLVDGAQSAPHLPIHVQALDADFFAISGHKVFGPTGIGALYAKTRWLEQLPPYQGGGNMIQDVTFAKTIYQEHPQRFEAGTQDIAGAVGLGAALDYLSGLGLPAIAAYEHALLEAATEGLLSIPGLRLIGTAANKASVLSFVIDGIPSDRIAKHLDQHGIAVRFGHHCAQPALRRFGLESTVRPSLAFYNTQQEIDELVRVLRQLTKR